MSRNLFSKDFIQGFYLHCQNCRRALGCSSQLQIFITQVKSRVKIPRRHMAAQSGTPARKPTPIKFKTIPKPEVKTDELGTVSKIILAMFPLTAYGLAYWQYERKKWKQNLLDLIDERAGATPVPLTELMTRGNLSDLEYTPVWLEGEFDHSREALIGFRPNFQPDRTPKGFKPNGGLWIVTPFKLKDTGREVLVNRGWVPRAWMDPETRAEGQITGNVKISGMIRAAEKKNPLDINPIQDPKNPRLFSYRDIPLIAGYLGTDPVFIDCDNESSVKGGPIGGQTNLKFNNRHMEYILTWLSLAIGMSVLWYNRAFPRTMATRYTRKRT
ncbi:surfeit locus protein 1-like [Saccostrea cucullata]|uniref:surfeit locus protein 1-like n=1 Tax=Saccostrea cuccullata TaxID=36930 RepID=UPI002ED5C582